MPGRKRRRSGSVIVPTVITPRTMFARRYYGASRRATRSRAVATVSRVPLATRGYRPNAVELKVNDLGLAAYQVNTAGSMILLCNPQQGADMNARIGRQITVKSIYVRGYVRSFCSTLNASAVSSPSQLCRMILIYDAQPNGALPIVTDILNAAHPSSHLNLNNRDRFKILADKTYCIDPMTLPAGGLPVNATGVGVQCRLVKKFKRCNLNVTFNGSTGNISDINTGAILMMWIGNAVGSTNHCIAELSTRVRYSDV